MVVKSSIFETNFNTRNTMSFRFKLLFVLCLAVNTIGFSQEEETTTVSEERSSGRFTFGTTVGGNFDDGHFNGSISPMLIYNFNDTFGLGAGYNYSRGVKADEFETIINGGSLIGIINVLNNFQLSAEFERSNVVITYDDSLPNTDENFWYSGLFFGAGINIGKIIVGVRYNAFYEDTDNNTYPSRITPYVRLLL